MITSFFGFRNRLDDIIKGGATISAKVPYDNGEYLANEAEKIFREIHTLRVA